MLQRKRWVKITLLAALCMLGFLLMWGVAIEPRWYDVREEAATIPGLPAGWEGKRIALIADLQVGMWLGNTGTVKRIVKHLVVERPAAVLIAGDFVYNPSDDDKKETDVEELKEMDEKVDEAVSLVRPLIDARIPVIAVLGNHDYGMMTRHGHKNDYLARKLTTALHGIGVTVLQNTVAQVWIDSDVKQSTANGSRRQTLHIAGVGSLWAQNDAPKVALSQVAEDAPRVLLMHNPDSFSALPPGSAPLALAGHTHGGQVRIPFLPTWSWLALVQDDAVQGDGWIVNLADTGNRLYVSRGIGFSTVPVRINCRPEVTFFRLHSGR